jgi:hypothetical protein
MPGPRKIDTFYMIFGKYNAVHTRNQDETELRGGLGPLVDTMAGP